MRKLLVVTFVLLIASLGLAQDKTGGKVHGYVFGDYYYKVDGEPAKVAGSSQFSSVLNDMQAFQFRRLYLYYDHTINETFSTQFLLEGNDKIFEPGGRHGVFIKTAYLAWKGIFTNSDLQIGLVPTPTWSAAGSEKFWGYRSVEKTITDYRGLGGASDIGVSLKGKIDNGGMISYVAMVGNGAGQKPETDKHKKYYGAVILNPIRDLTIDGYVDFEPTSNDKNRTTLRGVAAYSTKAFTVGAEYVSQIQDQGLDAAGNKLNAVRPYGLSFFARAPIPGTDQFTAFARFDMFDPNPKVSTIGYKETFMVVGLDYMPVSDVHIIPNFWLNSFSPKGTTVAKKADMVGRVTFFYVYK